VRGKRFRQIGCGQRVNLNADGVYLDSSAIVKLVVQESDSHDLASFLQDRPRRISCALARVEVVHAVRGQGDATVVRARGILQNLFLLRLDDRLLEDAGTLEPHLLRSLDAIHLAAARTVRDWIHEFVTYDLRLAEAARLSGFTVIAPGARG
jgi:predicted nucleic acid-binding protein